MSTREKIIEVALRLFGEQGFARTSVAQIEGEAGLLPGGGGLFRHFRSKRELLTEAVTHRLAQRGDWEYLLDPEFSFVGMLDSIAPTASRVDRLLLLSEMGLARLDHNRDVSRILMRDNSIDDSVLAAFRHDEYEVVMTVVTRALTELAGGADGDWPAAAAVLVGAVSHYWLMADIFDGEHPSGIDSQRYLRATAELVAARLDEASEQ
ncbi:TetR/AcrR family transcriptional regulator [Rhodococcus sp. UNC363MFTsu5.1]|uniref:TetR/AcrR family transcriptional regulator n=1 Tax=Rhodococcus sp. UNC363MFTsu5.1 TaxID=1449069 RepID=UPI000485A3FE|nr:helix-turn-helix domain-containing protein [Rhodococcus sp. UNC363MFTsu5.1]